MTIGKGATYTASCKRSSKL